MPHRLSDTVNRMVGSEILKISGEVKQRIASGEKLYNLTVGDYNPDIFPIPKALRDLIIQKYKEGATNYPMANGEPVLREAVAKMHNSKCGVNYSPEEIVIGAGGRPLLYCIFLSILNPGDGVIYPVPSWNNEHYCILNQAQTILIHTTEEDYFMPHPSSLKPHLKDANILALNSPLNPSGTVIRKDDLLDICSMVLEENERRGKEAKPLYLLYDQIYSNMVYGKEEHYNPVGLEPEMKDYTILIDGISKWLAGTGVRVGWAAGPLHMMQKIKTLLGHVGAWSPKPEQLAVAQFLHEPAMQEFLTSFRERTERRLEGFYHALMRLKNKGLPVDAIAPEAAIYLTVKFDLVGARTPKGSVLNTVKDVFSYLLNEAKVAFVPFYAFGASSNLPWFRLSIGTTRSEDIPIIEHSLERAIEKLTWNE
jgi:aspartate aminotransferase